MARIVTCGYEAQSLNSNTEGDGYRTITDGVGPTISTATVHSGAASLRVSGIQGTYYTNADIIDTVSMPTLALDTTYYWRFYFRKSGNPSSNAVIATTFSDDGIAQLGRLRLTTTGTLRLSNRLNTQVGSDSSALTTDQWYRIIIVERINTSGNGRLELWLDGSQVAAADTDVGNAAIRRIQVGSSTVNMGGFVFFFDTLALNDVSPYEDGLAALSGEGSVTALGVRAATGAAGLDMAASLDASGARAVAGTAALSGEGLLTASGAKALAGSADLSGEANLTASGVRAVTGTASLDAEGSLTGSGIRGATGLSSLSGEGTLSATGSAALAGAASLSGASDLQASGVARMSGASSLSSDLILSVTGARALSGAATLEGNSDLTALGVRSATGASVLSGALDMTTAGAAVRYGAAALQGALSLVSSGAMVARGAASLVGSLTLTAVGSAVGPPTEPPFASRFIQGEPGFSRPSLGSAELGEAFIKR